MSRLAQDKKFRKICAIVTTLFILMLLFNDQFSSQKLLLARYEAVLAPIHVETISGIEFQKAILRRHGVYNFIYEIQDADRNELLETLGKKFEENGWEFISQWKNKEDDIITYTTGRDIYLVNLYVGKKYLTVNIRVQVNRLSTKWKRELAGAVQEEIQKRNGEK